MQRQALIENVQRAFHPALVPSLVGAIQSELRNRNLWKPFPDREDGSPHPQRLALESKADILGYGGQAGGGKSDLLLGAAKECWRGVIFRRVFPSLDAIVDRSQEIYAPDDIPPKDRNKYNDQKHRWVFNNGARLFFRSLQHEKDVSGQQGQPKDFYGFDELTEFTEYQFRFVTGWNRSTKPGQRKRVIATMNPPTSEDGRWVIRYFAPWLDPEYQGKRAKAGELRWFTTVAGKDLEVKDGRPFILDAEGQPNYDFDPAKVNAEDILEPKSRTFIFASVRDNPILLKSGYVATLQALPEPLRSLMLKGDFTAGLEEDAWRVIPLQWVRAAQARWEKNKGKKLGPMDQMGVDVSRGITKGHDRTVLTPRHGNRIEEQKVAKTADGPRVVQHIILAKPEETTLVTIDVIGVGSSPVDFARLTHRVYAFNGAEKSKRTSKQGGLKFRNRRASAYWYLRECLDPASGLDMELPPDPELTTELCSPRWELTPLGIQIEAKEDIATRLGRSPDKADSVVYANAPSEESGMGLFDQLKGEYVDEQAKDKAPPKEFDWHK